MSHVPKTFEFLMKCEKESERNTITEPIRDDAEPGVGDVIDISCHRKWKGT